MLTIDINCDVGEGLHNETELMPYISSCNIACGGHAGDEETITRTIKLALKHHVKIGAHPSFPDKENFGRKIMNIASAELQQSIEAQIQLIQLYTQRLDTKLHHIKAHGALYDLAAKDVKTAQTIINAVKNTLSDVFLYVPYNSVLAELAKKNGLKTKTEAFADRNYNTNLTLVSRKNKNAVLSDKQLVLNHLLKMILEKKVVSVDGEEVRIEAITFCVHGDNPSVVEVVKYISKELPKNGIKIE